MAERNVLLKSLKHPFLVRLHYSFQTPEKLYFVLDYVNGGEVKDLKSMHEHLTKTEKKNHLENMIKNCCFIDMHVWQENNKDKMNQFYLYLQ